MIPATVNTMTTNQHDPHLQVTAIILVLGMIFECGGSLVKQLRKASRSGGIRLLHPLDIPIVRQGNTKELSVSTVQDRENNGGLWVQQMREKLPKAS
jgi:hypothetical protein